MTRSVSLCLAFVLAAVCPMANCPAIEIAPADFEQKLLPLVESHDGEVAIAVRLLDQNDTVVAEWSFQGNAVMPTASLIKLPVMVEAYRQASTRMLSMEDGVTLREADKVPGSGILSEHFSPGATFPLADAIRLMIRYSDNTATNLVVDRIGLASTSQAMRGLGYPETQLHAKVFRRDTSIALERSKKYGLGSTTALDMVSLLTRIERREVVSPAACQQMLDHLLTCDDTHKFPRFLPDGTKIAHKTGSVTRSRTAAGIIYMGDQKLILCVLSDNNSDTSWGDTNAGDLLCSNVAKAAFGLVESRGAEQPVGPSELKQGAFGEVVESLQRTLNIRNQAELSVDGDFGPATEAAVRSFQVARELPETGIVDKATWEALGTLVTADEPVPPPDVVNTEELEVSAALDIAAPPAATAKAWAILDRRSGEFVGSLNGDQQLPMASTTKIMTAFLVLELAERHPEVLNEVVVFSNKADQTPGSTAGIRAGEQVMVRELLYGLLLPSGNDASVALAEHFGARLGEPNGQTEFTSVQAFERFVSKMNAKASELGLKSTHFVNTSGLSDDEHFSSASDLARLAHAALKLEGMSDYVSTRQRGCRLTSVAGYSRDVVWKNTNRLLTQKGFLGVKTGTTTAAGACLVACGKSGEREHIVVVLGCPNSDARYVDSRNLFAWCWRQ